MELTQTSSLLGIALVGSAVVIAGAIGFVYLRRRKDNLQTLLRALDGEVLSNVFIPDGTGAEIHIDHLILTPHGLILLDIKDVQGMVFAGELMDSWSATHEGARIAFENPIPSLQARAAALALLAPGVPIEARVLFVKDAQFPKGHPQMVTTVPALIAAYREQAGAKPSVDYTTQWQAIQSAAL